MHTPVVPPVSITVSINDTPLVMGVDTGAAVTIILKGMFYNNLSCSVASESTESHALKTYSGNSTVFQTAPCSSHEQVETDIRRLEKENILVPVAHSEWTAPIVMVPESDRTIRICRDYKVTINPYLDIDQYPLPKTYSLFWLVTNNFRRQTCLKLINKCCWMKNPRSILRLILHVGCFATLV